MKKVEFRLCALAEKAKNAGLRLSQPLGAVGFVVFVSCAIGLGAWLTTRQDAASDRAAPPPAPVRASNIDSACTPDAVPPSLPTNARIGFVAFGDQGTGDTHQIEVARAIERVASTVGDVKFAVLLGDNFYPRGVHSRDDPQWVEKFEAIYDGPCLREMPFYAVPGNHDHRGSIDAQIAYSRERLGSGRWQMPHHFYVVDFGKVDGRPLLRVVFIDTGSRQGENNPFSAEQATTIRGAFSGQSDVPVWRIVAGHHPVRSFGEHGGTEALHDWLLPALSDSDVDLYLSAHDHNLQVISAPGEPLYVISGGGGRKLYSISMKAAAGDRLDFGSKQHGFAYVVATPTSLTIELYNESAVAIYRQTLAKGSRPRGTSATSPALVE